MFIANLFFQAKVLQYREQNQVMENRLLEVNHLASQSQIRLNDTNEVLKSLEERLRATEVLFFSSLLSTRFPSAGLSATHFHADWLLYWSLAAKWARLLITQLTAAYPTH